MDGWILNSRAASAAVLSPLDTMRLISACCCGESFGRHPPMRPSRRADSNPAFVLSRSMARSNSAYCGEPQYADYAECAIMQSHSAEVAL